MTELAIVEEYGYAVLYAVHTKEQPLDYDGPIELVFETVHLLKVGSPHAHTS